jgi:transposase
MGSRRSEWADRVRRWRRSGLTAGEFADSIGVKAGTLRYWASRLGRQQHAAPTPKTAPTAAEVPVRPPFIELIAGAAEDPRFELEFGNGRRLRIPPGFDAATLERLLRVVEDGR